MNYEELLNKFQNKINDYMEKTLEYKEAYKYLKTTSDYYTKDCFEIWNDYEVIEIQEFKNI